MDTSLLSQLRCVIVPGQGKYCHPDFYEYYDAAYDCWRRNVQDGLRSLNQHEQASHLASDNFWRHDGAVCLFHDDIAIGLVPFVWFAPQRPAVLEHSYFRYYPKPAIERLKAEKHQLIMVPGTMVVDVDWRKSKIGVGVSEILFGLIVKQFLASPATLILVFTRNDRKTNEITYRHGGTIWVKDFQAYGATSDVIAFHRDTAHQSNIEGVAGMVETFWKQRVSAVMQRNLSETIA